MTVENKIKAFLAVISLAGFFFGVFQFLQVQAIAAKKTYLERKLAWCEAAIRTTSAIATASPPTQENLADFWEMYWGVMGAMR